MIRTLINGATHRRRSLMTLSRKPISSFVPTTAALLEFAVQHPEAVAGYIKTIAANVAHDHFKSLHSQKRGSGREKSHIRTSIPMLTPGSGRPSSDGTSSVVEADRRCLSTCSAGPDQERDRLIFWLYYQQGMSAKAIAVLPTVGLTSKGVESAILRLTRLVRQQLVEVRSETSRGEPGEKGFRPAESY